MRAASLVAVLAVSTLATSQPQVLHVLRAAPQSPAEPTAEVTVTFDRPVAGQLDGTVDPRTIFSIAPAVAGNVEWRDPITLRFTPSAPLAPSATYTVTVDTAFQAMDGSRLSRRHTASRSAWAVRACSPPARSTRRGAIGSSDPTRSSSWS